MRHRCAVSHTEVLLSASCWVKMRSTVAGIPRVIWCFVDLLQNSNGRACTLFHALHLSGIGGIHVR